MPAVEIGLTFTPINVVSNNATTEKAVTNIEIKGSERVARKGADGREKEEEEEMEEQQEEQEEEEGAGRRRGRLKRGY